MSIAGTARDSTRLDENWVAPIVCQHFRLCRPNNQDSPLQSVGILPFEPLLYASTITRDALSYIGY